MNLVTAGLALALLPTADGVDARKYGWFTDYGAAKTEAKRTGKPMLLVFRCEP